MIDESNCNLPNEPVNVVLTKNNEKIFATTDLGSAFNRIPLDEDSMR